ncbi:MAG TPA: hypothetical protein VGN90_10920, partial [Pyrinomonadaceae bacterium]|nr:hypothetical protein [Pyrinomonadaceae bacterium]
MSEENDLSRSAVGLKSLPTLDELVAQLAPSTWNILKPLLARLPLLNLLTEIMQLACRRGGEKEKRPLLDLARLAVSKHQYTNRLYTEIVDAVSSWKPEAAESPLPHLLPQDARLAMEMLSFLAELFRMNGNYEPGVQSFRLAERIADRFGLVLNKAIVFHQLGNYETQHAQLAKAEAAYRIAANLFAPIAPDLEKRSNYQRAVIYKLRLQFEADPSEPEDIESIMARDPKARELVLLARARKAVGRDDLAGADNLLGSLRQSQTNDEIAGEKLVIEARMARRKGEFEKAELLLKQASKISSRSLELNWETFYLARDLGHNEESQAILERLKNESEGLRVDYQKAIVAYNTRDHKTAEKLLRNCLLQATNDTVRADCKAMLALVSDNALEARRIFHEAIGLYVKLDRKLDHAISLSHLATVEFVDALRQKEGG